MLMLIAIIMQRKTDNGKTTQANSLIFIVALQSV